MTTSPPRLSRRAVLTGTAALALSAPALVRADTPATVTLTGRAFATEWAVTLPSGSATGPLLAPLRAQLSAIDAQMSPWRGDSDITRFNRAPAGTHPLPPETARVAAAALALAQATGGAFDPTVGPAVARWGFGPIADGTPGWQNLYVTGDSATKPHPGLTLDLCGIAKGHALDRMTDIVASHGMTDYLIDLGGELAARGLHPSGRPWRVGIEHPSPDATALAGTLALDNRAVATSGTRANGYTLAGHRYSHIIDPATGAPVSGRLASVSVLAVTAAQADGWATALMAAGDTRGPALARTAGIPALFLSLTETGLASLSTNGFRDYLT